MCLVSMVYDHYNQPPQQPYQPFQWPLALPDSLPWNKDVLDELKKVIERIDRIDKALGLPECHDPKKAEWMKKIEKKVKEKKKRVKATS